MGRPRAFDEDKVLDEAAVLFWNQGYEGTSLTDLETRLGVGRQSLYDTFGDKRSLFLKSLERYGSWNADRLAGLQSANAGLDAIREYFAGVVEFLTPVGSRPGCLMTNSISEIGDSDEDVATRCRQNQKRVIEAFENALTNALRRGDVADDLPVKSTARMLMAQTYGLATLSKAGLTRGELQESIGALLERLE